MQRLVTTLGSLLWCFVLVGSCSEFVDLPTDVGLPEDTTVQPLEELPGCVESECDDGNPCTVDRCGAAGAGCRYDVLPDEVPCSDGLFCTVNDQCTGGQCLGNNVECPSQMGGCLVGVCDEVLGACTSSALPDGSGCDDGNACTLDDRCVANVCVPVGLVQCDTVDEPCRTNTCNPEVGQCELMPIADGALCTDADPCTVNDACFRGFCNGVPMDCSGLSSGCSIGSCNSETGTCGVSDAADGMGCDDGSLCTNDDKCAQGVCAGTPKLCGALDVCQQATCDESTGTCTGPVPANNSPCDDADACTSNDVCESGICVGVVVVDCSHLDDGCFVGVCQAESGACEAGMAPDGIACEDGSSCTVQDTCQSGLCVGTTKDCSSVSGDCTAGVCAADGTCIPSPDLTKDGAMCGSENKCIVGGQCDSGQCIGLTKDCSVVDAECLEGICEPTSGLCITAEKPFGTACEDGEVCTTGEVCSAGECVPYGEVDCSGLAAPCVIAFCSEADGGCITEMVLDGTACSDGSNCTVDDVCFEGSCSGTPKDCSSLDSECLAGTCLASTGACVASPILDGTPCDDGVACADDDVCIAGSCVGGIPDNCPCPNPHYGIGLLGGCLTSEPASFVSSDTGFTIEFWIRTTSGESGIILDSRLSTQLGEGDWSISYDVAGGTGQLRYHYGTMTGTDATLGMSNTTLNDGSWHHIALTRLGVTMRWWVDGQGLFAQNTSNMVAISEPIALSVGCSKFDTSSVQLELDGLRISTFARYLTPFDPPGRHMPDVGTSALWRFDVPEPSLEVTGVMGNTLSIIGTVAGVSDVADAFSSSCCGDGYISYGEQCDGGAECSSSCDGEPLLATAWQLGTSSCITLDDETLLVDPTAMTLEFWFRWSGETGVIIRRGGSSIGGYRISVVEGGYLQFEGEANGGLVTALSDTAVAADEWHHVAMLYANPQFVRWYVDGAAEPTVVLSYPMPEYLSVEPFQIGCTATAATGRIDSVRASPIVRYPQSFIPNSVLMPDQDTSFLFAFDQPALYWPDGQVRVLDLSPYARDGRAESDSFVGGYP